MYVLYFISLFSYLPCCPEPPLILADPSAVSQAVAILQQAQRPLVIIGKGICTFCVSRPHVHLVSTSGSTSLRQALTQRLLAQYLMVSVSGIDPRNPVAPLPLCMKLGLDNY